MNKKVTHDTNQHSIQREGTAYNGDQPVTYEIACSCGEVFDHIAPQNALNQWHNHVRESLEDDRREARDGKTRNG